VRADEYIHYDAIGLSELISEGQLLAKEAAEAAIETIETHNPAVNAVVLRNYERALSELPSRQSSPLSGVPFLLKDANVFSRDMPTTFGSRYFFGASPRPDSLLVSRWRAAGLVILGKTNTSEYAIEYTTEPAAYGATRNPWNLALTAGGSSGGAAAAVASGMVPIAHATDLGGSIRLPAACCGVFGFKPSAGLNSVGPYFGEIASGLNSDHVISRSVRDSAASLDVTTGHLAGRGPYLQALDKPVQRLRIGVAIRDAQNRLAGESQTHAVAAVASELARQGHVVTHLDDKPFEPVGDWFDLLWLPDIVALIEGRAKETGGYPHPGDIELLTQVALEKMRRVSAQDIHAAILKKRDYARRHLARFTDIDVLLTPSLGSDPLPIGSLKYAQGVDFEDWAERAYRFAPFSVFANITGQPSASCPFQMTRTECPAGVQVTAAPGADKLLFQLCREIEEISDWARNFGRLRLSDTGEAAVSFAQRSLR
jgi:amidase